MTRAWRASVAPLRRRRPRPTCSGSKPATSFVAASMRRRRRCSRGESKSTPTPFRSRSWPRRSRRPPRIRRWRRRRSISGCGAIRRAARRPRWRWRRPSRRPATVSTRAPRCRRRSIGAGVGVLLDRGGLRRAGRSAQRRRGGPGIGAEVWEASSLVPGLRAAAAVKLAPSNPARALAALGDAAGGSLSDAALALGPSAVARLAERAGNRAAFEAALEAAEALTRNPAQVAWLALRRASSIASWRERGGGEARVRSLERALEAVPRHPLALGLYLAAREVDVAAAAAAMARVGALPRSPRSAGRWPWPRRARSRSAAIARGL